MDTVCYWLYYKRQTNIFVGMVRIEPERVKNAAAIYRYQADCDGAWGEIHFDFEKKQIRIKRLAEWDTIKSHIYAWKVICFIALNEGLPKKENRF